MPATKIGCTRLPICRPRINLLGRLFSDLQPDEQFTGDCLDGRSSAGIVQEAEGLGDSLKDLPIFAAFAIEMLGEFQVVMGLVVVILARGCAALAPVKVVSPVGNV